MSAFPIAMTASARPTGLDLLKYLTRGNWNRVDRLRLIRWLRFEASRDELEKFLEYTGQLADRRSESSLLDMLARFGGKLDTELVEQIIEMGSYNVFEDRVLDNPHLSREVVEQIAHQLAQELCQRSWREDRFGKRLIQAGSKMRVDQIDGLLDRGFDPGEKAWQEMWDFIDEAIEEDVFGQALAAPVGNSILGKTLWLLLANPGLTEDQLCRIARHSKGNLGHMVAGEMIAHPSAGPRLWDQFLNNQELRGRLGRGGDTWLRSDRTLSHPPVREYLLQQDPHPEIFAAIAEEGTSGELTRLVQNWGRKDTEELLEILKEAAPEHLEAFHPEALAPILGSAPSEIRQQILRIAGRTGKEDRKGRGR